MSSQCKMLSHLCPSSFLIIIIPSWVESFAKIICLLSPLSVFLWLLMNSWIYLQCLACLLVEWLLLGTSPWTLNCKLNSSYSLSCRITTQLIESQYPSYLSSNCLPPNPPPPSVPQNFQSHHLDMHLKISISKPQLISACLLVHTLQAHLQTWSIATSMCHYKLHNNGHQVQLWVYLILTSKYICKFTQWHWPSASVCLWSDANRLHLHIWLIMASLYIALFNWSPSLYAPLDALKSYVQPVRIDHL